VSRTQDSSCRDSEKKNKGKRRAPRDKKGGEEEIRGALPGIGSIEGWQIFSTLEKVTLLKLGTGRRHLKVTNWVFDKGEQKLEGNRKREIWTWFSIFCGVKHLEKEGRGGVR